MNIFSIILFVLWLMVVPCGVLGQTSSVFLQVDPQQMLMEQGKSFIAKIKVKSDSPCINVVHVDISFPKDKIELIDFGRGNSVISLWTAAPDREAIKAANNSGTVSFEGGIPGGFCGSRAGTLAENNILGELVFMPNGNLNLQEAGNAAAAIKIESTSKAFLNDGEGTEAIVTFEEAQLLWATSTQAVDPWIDRIRKDNIPPEQFEIKISRDPLFENGKYFITFTATDKQTGIDHYDVSEVREDEGGDMDSWIKAESPYVLNDQALRSKIKVRAVDKAGNETVSEYSPVPESTVVSVTGDFKILLAAMFAGAVLVILGHFIKKKHE